MDFAGARTMQPEETSVAHGSAPICRGEANDDPNET